MDSSTRRTTEWHFRHSLFSARLYNVKRRSETIHVLLLLPRAVMSFPRQISLKSAATEPLWVCTKQMFYQNTQTTKLVLPGRQWRTQIVNVQYTGSPILSRSARSFRGKSLEERKLYLKENHICYRCCGSTRHLARDCKATIKCFECNSEKHISALHPGPPPPTESVVVDIEENREQRESVSSSVTSMCTEVCGNTEYPRSCSKICLVRVYPVGRKEKATKMYAVLDEQSNKSLAKTEFFNLFDVKASSAPYRLKTCSGTTETSGRRAGNFIIESMDGKLQLPLPTLIECDMMPDDRTEIPCQDVARHHPHQLPTRLQP